MEYVISDLGVLFSVISCLRHCVSVANVQPPGQMLLYLSAALLSFSQYLPNATTVHKYQGRLTLCILMIALVLVALG